MPTHEESAAFLRDFRRLTDPQKARFARGLGRFVADLLAMEAGKRAWFRPGLRVKPVRVPQICSRCHGCLTGAQRSHGVIPLSPEEGTSSGTDAATTTSCHDLNYWGSSEPDNY